MDGDVWSRFHLDPRRPEHAHLRASDRDRDVVHEVLATAVAEGRLTVDEHGERAELVAVSKTLGELPRLVRDLVPDRPVALTTLERLTPEARRAEAERIYRRERRNAVAEFVYPTAISVGIWALLGAGFFWPVFLIVACGLRLGHVVVNRDDRIVAIDRKLERRQVRALRARERRLPPAIWRP